MYRRYVTLHGIATCAVFSIAAAWIVMSALRHSNAEAKCIQDFFNSTDSASDSSEGEALCNIFSWVDIGIMGVLWTVLVSLQVSHFIRRFFLSISKHSADIPFFCPILLRQGPTTGS